MRAAFTSDDDIAELVEFCTSREATVTPLRAEPQAEPGQAAHEAEPEEIDYFDGDDEDTDVA